MARRTLEPVLARAHINAPAYGRVRYTTGHEQHGPHLLPIAVFAGGARVALYSVPEPDNSGWRPVYARAPS